MIKDDDLFNALRGKYIGDNSRINVDHIKQVIERILYDPKAQSEILL